MHYSKLSFFTAGLILAGCTSQTLAPEEEIIDPACLLEKQVYISEQGNLLETTYEYDNLNNLIKESVSGGYQQVKIYTYSFNTDGLPTKIDISQDGEPYETSELSYFPSKSIKSKIVKNLQYDRTEFYDYDEAGNEVRYESDGFKRVKSYNSENLLIEEKATRNGNLETQKTYAYSSAGKMTLSTILQNGQTTESKYIYNADNILISSTLDRNGKLIYNYRYTHDEKGNRTLTEVSDGSEDYHIQESLQYYPDNTMKQHKVYWVKSNNGLNTQLWIEQEFTEMGQEKEMKWYAPETGLLDYTISYIYQCI